MTYRLRKCPVCDKLVHIQKKIGEAGNTYYEIHNICKHFSLAIIKEPNDDHYNTLTSSRSNSMKFRRFTRKEIDRLWDQTRTFFRAPLGSMMQFDWEPNDDMPSEVKHVQQA